MKMTLLKSVLILVGLVVIGFIFFGYTPNNDRQSDNLDSTDFIADTSPQPGIDFEGNDKCRQLAKQINPLVYKSENHDELLPQTKEEQILRLESDMEDGRVLKAELEELLDYPDVRALEAYDPQSGDEYQAIEVRCGKWPVGGAVLYLVNRTQNKVLATEANEFIWIKSFSDLDSDGTIELAFQDVAGGNCWGCSSMRVVRLAASSITEIEVPTDFIMSDIARRPESITEGYVIYANDISWENALNLPHCCGPWSHRYFHMDGRNTTDVSALFKAEYQELISTNNEYGPSISNSISNLLLYEAIEERDAGWQQFVKDWQQVDTSEVTGVTDYADKVFAELERQYQEQERFTPFDIDTSGQVRSRL